MESNKIKDLIAGRILDEYHKHKELEWHKIAANKLYSQWKEFYESEKDKEIAKWKELYEDLSNSNDFGTKCLIEKEKEISELKLIISGKTFSNEVEDLKAELDNKNEIIEKYIKMKLFVYDGINNDFIECKDIKEARKTIKEIVFEESEGIHPDAECVKLFLEIGSVIVEDDEEDESYKLIIPNL